GPMRHGNIDVPIDKVETLCKRWKITELSFFGSVLRDDFRPDSDVDVMVRFGPDEHWSLFDIVQIEIELGGILGRKADLSEREIIEKSDNPFFRRHARSRVELVYAA